MSTAVALSEVPVVGALDRDDSGEGVVFRRNPAWARPQIVEVQQDLVVRMPAGVRLVFTTGSRSIELDLDVTYFQLGAGEPLIPVLDLVVGGVVRESRQVLGGTKMVLRLDGSVDVEPGATQTVRFDLPGDAEVVEIWLPHNAMAALREVRIDDGCSLAPVADERPRWVHHGSSISHCLEALTPTQTWPALVARSAGLDLLNLGLGGNAQLDPHVARTIRDLPAELISLKVGINIINGDTMRERVFVPALHGFLDTIRDGHPTTPIVLVTPIVCPVAEDHPGPTIMREDGQVHVIARDPELSTGSLTLQRVRALITAVVAARADDNLYLVDGLALFGPADVDELPDGLHPSPEGYRRIAERFQELVFDSGLITTSARQEAAG